MAVKNLGSTGAAFGSHYSAIRERRFIMREKILKKKKLLGARFRILMRAGRVSGRYRGCFKTTVSEANPAQGLEVRHGLEVRGRGRSS